MRWPMTAALGSLLLTSAAMAEPTFPYKAYATADDVYVRSGPGENYYPTDKLKAGQEVEVYRHDPGGWYAIRPPAGSFSWVAGRHLHLDKDNLAKVAEDRVAARVGSRFSDVRDVIQVRLHRGEVVEVFDAQRTGPSNPTSSSTWYKIAPPSGEFRWVFGKLVDPEYSRDGLRRTHADDPAGHRGDAASPTTARVPTEPYESGPGERRRMSAAQFQAALEDVDVELSTMVVEEPTVWDFGELRERAQSLFNQAETAVERGRARTLVARIDRFEDIRQRNNTLNATREDMSRTDRQVARLSHATVSPADPEGRFDAIGKLIRIPAFKTGAPQYAVVDGKNNIRCYVTPAPGVNLAHYLGQQVGINGVRGYMPEQRANHVMARHVSVVDGTALR